MKLKHILEALRTHIGTEKYIDWEDWGETDIALELVADPRTDVIKVRRQYDYDDLWVTTHVGGDPTLYISYNPEGHCH